MKIKDLASSNRPRERLVKKGVKALSDAEVLALILDVGTKKMSAVELANQILKEVSIKELANLSYYELVKFSGIKAAKASKIIASFELAKRALAVRNENFVFKYSSDIYEYLKEDYLLLTEELITILILDSNLHLRYKLTFKGENCSSSFSPQIILRYFVKYSCVSYILVHNHPSGSLTPSDDDYNATKELDNIFRPLGYYLADHIIVSDNGYFSFLENGLVK